MLPDTVLLSVRKKVTIVFGKIGLYVEYSPVDIAQISPQCFKNGKDLTRRGRAL